MEALDELETDEIEIEFNEEKTQSEEDIPDLPEEEEKVTRRKAKRSKHIGPGRPRKNPRKEPLPKKGVAKAPQKDDSVVELLYDNPLLIKKIVAFFKSVASAKIQILFRMTDVIFYARDHHGKSHIRIRIDCNKLNHYYCKAPINIGIAQRDLELVLNVVDKDYSSILIIASKENVQKSLLMVLENSMEIDESQTIDLIGSYDQMEDEERFTNETYTIYWEWTGKNFKKCINDIKTMSDQFAITQDNCNKPLSILLTSINKKIHKNYVFKSPNKLKLKSKLFGDESFRIDMKVEYIKPISSAHIADEITILIDENKPLMTKAFVDNGVIEIKTLTDIIDDRPTD